VHDQIGERFIGVEPEQRGSRVGEQLQEGVLLREVVLEEVLDVEHELDGVGVEVGGEVDEVLVAQRLYVLLRLRERLRVLLDLDGLQLFEHRFQVLLVLHAGEVADEGHQLQNLRELVQQLRVVGLPRLLVEQDLQVLLGQEHEVVVRLALHLLVDHVLTS